VTALEARDLIGVGVALLLALTAGIVLNARGPRL